MEDRLEAFSVIENGSSRQGRLRRILIWFMDIQKRTNKSID